MNQHEKVIHVYTRVTGELRVKFSQALRKDFNCVREGTLRYLDKVTLKINQTKLISN